MYAINELLSHIMDTSGWRRGNFVKNECDASIDQEAACPLFRQIVLMFSDFREGHGGKM